MMCVVWDTLALSKISTDHWNSKLNCLRIAAASESLSLSLSRAARFEAPHFEGNQPESHLLRH